MDSLVGIVLFGSVFIYAVFILWVLHVEYKFFHGKLSLLGIRKMIGLSPKEDSDEL